MPTFTKTYDETSPSGSDQARFGDDQFRNDKAAVQERYGLEHYEYGKNSQNSDSETADGRHKPGFVSVVLIDTAANILATTPGGKGALGYGTDTGLLYIWDGSTWDTSTVGGGVNSIQRGQTTVGPSATVNETITAVDLDKAVLVYNTDDKGYTSAKLTTTTNIEMTNLNGAFGTVVSWQVVEYI